MESYKKNLPKYQHSLELTKCKNPYRCMSFYNQ